MGEERAAGGACKHVEEPSGGQLTDGSTAVEWTSHPVARHQLKGAILLLITLLCCCGVWLWLEHWFYAAFSGVVLFLSTMRYYFPTQYRLDAEGVRAGFLGTSKLRPWSDFKNVYVHETAVFLAPFGKPSRLDAFRGMWIVLGANKDEAVAYVKERVAPAGRASPRNGTGERG